MFLKNIAIVIDRELKTIRKYIKAEKLLECRRNSAKPSKVDTFK